MPQSQLPFAKMHLLDIILLSDLSAMCAPKIPMGYFSRWLYYLV